MAAENKLTSTKGVKTLSMLITLILSKNEIREIPGLESLSLLQKLSLSHNQLTEFMPGPGMSQLTELRLNSNRILKLTLPVPKLKVLDIGNNPGVAMQKNKSTKGVLKEISALKKLQNLNAKDTGFTEEDIKEVCPKLVSANILNFLIGGI